MTLTTFTVCCSLLALLWEPAEAECPNPSAIPVKYNSTHHNGVYIYLADPTSSHHIQSCNGSPMRQPEGSESENAIFHFMFDHAVVVRPGCVFYTFRDFNYAGRVTEYPTGVYPRIPQESYLSFKVRCNKAHFNCHPKDRFETLLTCDATAAVVATDCNYIKTIGTSFSRSVAHTMSRDVTLEAEMTASFFTLFSTKLKTSLTTGYNWEEVSAHTKDTSVSIQVKAKAPAGYILKIEQAVGHCGGSRVRTELFRITHYGNKTGTADSKYILSPGNKDPILNV